MVAFSQSTSSPFFHIFSAGLFMNSSYAQHDIPSFRPWFRRPSLLGGFDFLSGSLHRLGARMARLVNAELAAAGEAQLGQQTPTLILNRGTGDLPLFHRLDEGFDCVAHQIELVEG